MDPTDEELLWASNIKKGARQDPTINSTFITDLEYLQYAIISKSKVTEALNRIRKVQKFKERYSIKRDGSVEEASRDLNTFMSMNPGFLLSFSKVSSREYFVRRKTEDSGADKTSSCDYFCETHDEIEDEQENDGKDHEPKDHDITPRVLCIDLGKWFTATLNSEEAFAVSLRALFYILQAVNADTLSMRSGYCHLADTGTVGWQNLSFETDRRASKLFGSSYPVRVRHVALLNTKSFIRWFYSVIIVRFIRRSTAKRIVFAGERNEFFFGNNLPQVGSSRDQSWYTRDVLPQAWGGVQREEKVVENILVALRQRYMNAGSFRL